MSNELIVNVQNRITEMQRNEGLRLPPNYSAGNALNSAYLILSDNTKGESLLEKCDNRSISKALLNMVIQGLSPAKNQCYFIPYGKQCTLLRSYFGSVSILERLSNVEKVHAEVIYEGDQFEIGSDGDSLIVTEYEPSFANRDNPIVGAFAWIKQTDGTKVYTVMTKKEIDISWKKAKTKNVQNEFPQEMTKRTILSRAAKMFINSSSDNDLLVQAINETTEDEYENNRKDVTGSADDKTVNLERQFAQTKQAEQLPENTTPIGTEIPAMTERQEVGETLLDEPNFEREEDIDDGQANLFGQEGDYAF